MTFTPRRLSRWLPALLCVMVLSACVETQPLLRADTNFSGAAQSNDAASQEALKSLAAMQDRLDLVAAPLLIKSQDLCKKLARPILGFSARNRYSYSPGFADVARDALGLGELLQVTGVMAGSGAARSGLQRGDALLSAGSKTMPQGPNAEYEAPEVLLPLIVGQSSVKLTVLRNGQSVAISVPLTRACAFRVEVGNSDIVNSFSDGRRIMVTRGMLKFVRSDEELAYVIAKEMAHNALHHPARSGAAATVRDVINGLMPPAPHFSSADKVSAIKPMPKDIDVLADRLALYMVARGGYSLDGAAAFWQRLARKVPASVSDGHTALHPNTAQRLAAIEKTVAEIKARRGGKKK